MSQGIVVLGHGSSSEVGEANDFLVALAGMVREKTGARLIETAYLNRRSQRQGLKEAVEKLAARGVKKIVVAPVFLTCGQHVQRDIPEEIEDLKKAYGGEVDIRMAPCIGADPRLAEIVVERIEEVAGSEIFNRPAGNREGKF